MSVRNAREWKRRKAKTAAIIKERRGESCEFWSLPLPMPQRYGGKHGWRDGRAMTERKKLWKIARARGFTCGTCGDIFRFTPIVGGGFSNDGFDRPGRGFNGIEDFWKRCK